MIQRFNKTLKALIGFSCGGKRLVNITRRWSDVLEGLPLLVLGELRSVEGWKVREFSTLEVRVSISRHKGLMIQLKVNELNSMHSMNTLYLKDD